MFVRLCFTLLTVLGCAGAFGQTCTVASHSIEQVQGVGESSPFVGKNVIVSGVVSAIFQTENQLQGFFIQAKDENPNASHGLFIYSQKPVKLYERLTIKGRVKEFYGLTELVNVQITQRCGIAQAIKPLKISYDLSNKQREALEGVLVELPSGVVSSTSGLIKYGQLELAAAWPNSNRVQRWLLDDGSTMTNPQRIAYLASVTNAAQLLPASQAQGVVGVVSFAFDEYRINPTEPVQLISGTSLAAKQLSSVRLVSFNIKNLFNGNGRGGQFLPQRGAKSQSEWQQQLSRVVASLAHLKADVFVLNEVENDGFGEHSAAVELVGALNKLSDGHYKAVSFTQKQTGSSAIQNVILYNAERVSTVGDGQSILQFADWRDDKHRPFLLQRFIDKPSGQRFSVVAAHLKSKAGNCTADTPRLKEKYGACSTERLAAIDSLNSWLKTLAIKTPIFLLGDFNALPEEPAISALQQSNWHTPFELTKHYSYVYQGNANLLDYIWLKSVEPVSVISAQYWGINAGAVYPANALAGHDQFKNLTQTEFLNSSDHNPVLLDVKF